MNRRDFIKQTLIASVAASVAAPAVASAVSDATVLDAVVIDNFEVMWDGPCSKGTFSSPDLSNALKFLNELIFSDKQDVERFSEIKLKKNGKPLYHYAGGPFTSGHGRWVDDFLYTNKPVQNHFNHEQTKTKNN